MFPTRLCSDWRTISSRKDLYVSIPHLFCRTLDDSLFTVLQLTLLTAPCFGSIRTGIVGMPLPCVMLPLVEFGSGTHYMQLAVLSLWEP